MQTLLKTALFCCIVEQYIYMCVYIYIFIHAHSYLTLYPKRLMIIFSPLEYFVRYIFLKVNLGHCFVSLFLIYKNENTREK